MALKRMFSLSVVDTDSFLEMPISSRLLYYELGMRADDDGFIPNWKKILMFTGLKEDDLKLLIMKNFVIPFESGVIVIRHWRMNNYLQKDRTKPTLYQEELKKLSIDKSNVYNLDTECIHSIDKNSIDKNSIEEKEVQEKEEEICIQTIYDFVEQEFGRTLSPTEYEVIESWEDTEITRYAIKQAILNGAPRIKYIQTILDSYKIKNIKSVQEAQKDEEDYKKSKKQEINPKWIGQEIKKETLSNEEEQEIKELLKEFK